jgi:hypothetical protein
MNKKISPFAVSFLLFLATFTATSNKEFAAASLSEDKTTKNMLYVKPKTFQTLSLNDTFKADIKVINVENLYTWQIKLFFNSTVVKCINATYTPNHVFTGKSFVPVTPVIDDSLGFVLYGCTLIGNETPFTGNGTLCQLVFQVIALGQSDLKFSSPYGEDTFLLDNNLDLLYPSRETHVSELQNNLLLATLNSVYFLYADPTYMTRPEAAYDITAGGIIYGLCTNNQIQGFNTTKHWLHRNGAINTTTISGATVAMFGGPCPQMAVKYYEDFGHWLAPVKFMFNKTHFWFINHNHDIIGILPISNVKNGHEDMFVIEVFYEWDNLILIMYGFDWKGTWAAGIYFKETMSQSLLNYANHYYIFHWIDNEGQDGIPQTSEITMVASG